jgi:hypothetical protein
VLVQRAYARHTVRQQARKQLQHIQLQRIRRLHSAATAIQGCCRKWLVTVTSSTLVNYLAVGLRVCAISTYAIMGLLWHDIVDVCTCTARYTQNYTLYNHTVLVVYTLLWCYQAC